MLSETDDDPLPESYYKSDKTYIYDELNQLIKAEFTITQANKTDHIVYEYGFDVIGARSYVSTTTNGQKVVKTETSNKNGQITESRDDSGLTRYTYDKNGNISKEVKADGEVLTYQYNSLNQLISLTSSFGEQQYFEYDGLDNRIAKTIINPSGVNTESLVEQRPSTLEAELTYFAEHGYDHTTYNHKLESLEDALNSAKDNGLSCQVQTIGGYVDTTQIQELEYVNDITQENELVLEIRNFNRKQVTAYTYNGIQPVTTSNNHTFSTISSGQRNTIEGIIDVHGKVAVQDYTPYGSTLSDVRQKSVVNRLGFNGELEEGHDIQYLRARYYMHDNARFISQDTVHGSIGSVKAHNLYNYVEGDPVNSIDPSGHARKNPSSYLPKKTNIYPLSEGEIYGPPTPENIAIANELQEYVQKSSGVKPIRPDNIATDDWIEYLKYIVSICTLLDLAGAANEKANFVNMYNDNRNDPARAVTNWYRDLDDSMEGKLSDFSGYFVYGDNNYFTTKEGSFQSMFGFMDLYDHAGPLLGMDLNTDTFFFTVDGTEYRLQLWEGTYGSGLAYGGEIGLYYRPANSDNDWRYSNSDYYDTLPEEIQLRMKLEIYTNDGSLKVSNDTNDYANNGNHYWNAVFKPQKPFEYKAGDIYTVSHIFSDDKEFVEALKADLRRQGVFYEVIQRGTEYEVIITWENKQDSITYSAVIFKCML